MTSTECQYKKYNSKINALESELCKYFDELEEKYNEEIIRLRKAADKYAYVLQKQSFSDGFSLRCKLTFEAFINSEKLINK